MNFKSLPICRRQKNLNTYLIFFQTKEAGINGVLLIYFLRFSILKSKNIYLQIMVSSKRSAYTYFYFSAILFLLAYIFVTVKQMHEYGGWLLMLCLLSVAIAFRGNKFLKGLSYTLMIMAVVSLAMYHPQYFKTVGD